MFKNREDAAIQLARKLHQFKNQDGVVLAIPRGGVPIGYIIAKELGFQLEILLSKKIGHPLSSELAIGSVTLHGTIMNENFNNIPENYIEHESKYILQALKEKYKFYTGNSKALELKNKTVIITDDGVATGSTILGVVEAVQKNNPQKIIVAVPVSPLHTAQKISKIVDEFICLHMPTNFYGVGQFYYDFSQVNDEEVIHLLAKKIQKKTVENFM